jgi:hypothetical protein
MIKGGERGDGRGEEEEGRRRRKRRKERERESVCVEKLCTKTDRQTG